MSINSKRVNQRLLANISFSSELNVVKHSASTCTQILCSDVSNVDDYLISFHHVSQ